MCDYSHSGFTTYLGGSFRSLLNTRTHSNHNSIFILYLYNTLRKRVNNASVTSFALRNISKHHYPVSSRHYVLSEITTSLCKSLWHELSKQTRRRAIKFSTFSHIPFRWSLAFTKVLLLSFCVFCCFFFDEIFLILVLSVGNPTKCRAKFLSDRFGTGTLGRNKRKKELCYTS